MCIKSVEPKLEDLEELQEPKQYCKLCRTELDLNDKLGYSGIGFCGIGCILLDLTHEIALIKSKLKKLEHNIK